MKLRTIKFLLLTIFTSSSMLYSCSEYQMDEVNKNVDNPVDVQARFIMTDVFMRTAVNNVGGDLNTYLSSYVEHEVGTHNQLWDAEHRISQPQVASTFNNTWNNIYNVLRDLKIVIDKCSDGGSEAGNYKTLGIAQVMAAYNLALLTDMFGDVPYSEALNPFGNKTPKLDKQENLYSTVMELLDEALINLPQSDRFNIGGQDLLFNGSVDKWTKFAYGLKARYSMRLLNRSANPNAVLEDIITFTDLSFTSSSEEAAFNVYGSQNLNPLFDFQWSRDGLAASKSIADKFIERNDPRLRRNFADADMVQVNNFSLVGGAYDDLAVNGENLQLQYYYLTSIFVYSQTASTQLLSYHEVLFLKAEAMARLNKPLADIAAVLKNAVVSSIKNSEKSVATSFTAPTVLAAGYSVEETTSPITQAAMESYFDDEVFPLFEVNQLKEIAIQKYLAFFGASGESTEMYNDIRRWKAAGENFIELKNPNPFPVRLPYGNSETTTNPNVQSAYGNGTYVYSENVWWAGGTR